jgi:hypothetical protein
MINILDELRTCIFPSKGETSLSFDTVFYIKDEEIFVVSFIRRKKLEGQDLDIAVKKLEWEKKKCLSI